MSFKFRGAVTLVCLMLGTFAVGAGSAHADPVRHFEETMTIHCGSDTLVLVAKPGSSNVVTINGTPTNSVSILMGITVTVRKVDRLANPIATALRRWW